MRTSFRFFKRRQPLQRRIVEGNVGLHGLAHHELLERRRLVEERDRGLHARRRLVVPQAAVDVQLLEMRQRRQAAKLVLQRRGVHRDAREIQRMNAEIGRGQIGEISNRLALTFEHDAAAHAQHPFGDHAIGSRPVDLDPGAGRPASDRRGHPARRQRRSRQQARGQKRLQPHRLVFRRKTDRTFIFNSVLRDDNCSLESAYFAH